MVQALAGNAVHVGKPQQTVLQDTLEQRPVHGDGGPGHGGGHNHGGGGGRGGGGGGGGGDDSGAEFGWPSLILMLFVMLLGVNLLVLVLQAFGSSVFGMVLFAALAAVFAKTFTPNQQ